MREILFRGKALYPDHTAKKENGWVYGVPVPIKIDSYPTDKVELVRYHGYDELDYYELLSEDDEVDPKTIGQYTGLEDTNGKSIFEGDVVKIVNHETSVNGLYRVRYSDINHCWCLVRSPIHNRSFFTFSDLNGFAYDSEVVGNITDNPELLEEVCDI